MEKITEKNTKTTILGALREAEKKIVELERGKLKAEVKTTEKKTIETITKANEIMEVNVEDKITDLSRSVSTLLSKISEDIVTETNNLQTVKDAIAIKEAEMKELYSIEKQAHTLAGLVNAHQELKLAQEQELADAKEKAHAQLTEIENSIKIAREEYTIQIKEQKETLVQEHKRKEEEFKYDFARHQKQAYDTLKDELDNKHKKFTEEKDKTNAEIKEYKKSLDERDSLIGKREQKMDELEAEVAAIPAKIEAVRTESNEWANAKIKKKVAISEASFKKAIEADKRILEIERDNLKTQLDTTNEKMETLQSKLDEAYRRIQEMGIKMVSGSNDSKAFDKIVSLVSEKNNKS
jgi:hypothetical protein